MADGTEFDICPQSQASFPGGQRGWLPQVERWLTGIRGRIQRPGGPQPPNRIPRSDGRRRGLWQHLTNGKIGTRAQVLHLSALDPDHVAQHRCRISKYLSGLFGPTLAMDHDGVRKERANMLWTICVILLVLWALGMVTSYTMGGFLHVLLILAIVVLLVRVIQGRRSVV